jgi:uncharacterized coiled-coil protein SlyX
VLILSNVCNAQEAKRVPKGYVVQHENMMVAPIESWNYLIDAIDTARATIDTLRITLEESEKIIFTQTQTINLLSQVNQNNQMIMDNQNAQIDRLMERVEQLYPMAIESTRKKGVGWKIAVAVFGGYLINDLIK